LFSGRGKQEEKMVVEMEEIQKEERRTGKKRRGRERRKEEDRGKKVFSHEPRIKGKNVISPAL
jgi:hypothetical protein